MAFRKEITHKLCPGVSYLWCPCLLSLYLLSLYLIFNLKLKTESNGGVPCHDSWCLGKFSITDFNQENFGDLWDSQYYSLESWSDFLVNFKKGSLESWGHSEMDYSCASWETRRIAGGNSCLLAYGVTLVFP